MSGNDLQPVHDGGGAERRLAERSSAPDWTLNPESAPTTSGFVKPGREERRDKQCARMQRIYQVRRKESENFNYPQLSYDRAACR